MNQSKKRACSVLIRLCARLCIFVLLAALLAGCPSKEGTVPVSDVASLMQGPAPIDPPEFKVVDEAYWGFLRASSSDLDDDGNPLPGDQLFLDRNEGRYDNALSLLSYDPLAEVDLPLDYAGLNPQDISTADTGIVVALNTVDSAERSIEFTLLSRNDTVYTVNHATGEIRGLRHFNIKVCEIIPAQMVETAVGVSSTVEYRVINAPWVYVKTSEGYCNGTDTDFSDTAIQYYRLPINYQADADPFEVCAGEVFGDSVGTNTNASTCKTRVIETVEESEVRAQVVFGWTLDQSTPAANDYMLDYGFLGYGAAEKKLRFYDRDRNVVWSQTREIERFDVPTGDQNRTTYIAALQPLENYNYVYQFGRDVYVLNSKSELFDKTFTEADSILVDRNYQLDAEIIEPGSLEIISPMTLVHNDSDLLLVDQSKLFRYNYAPESFTPDPGDLPATYDVVYLDDILPPTQFDAISSFSQFDIRPCSEEGQDEEGLSQAEIDALVDACVNAHDVNDSQLPSPGEPWQFMTECDADLGCEVTTDTNDYCVTEAELAADPSLADLNNPCSPSTYTHFNELDDAANNAQLIGYMQYAEDQIRALEYQLEGSELYIVARMKERDLLLRYLYEVPLTAPKSSREQVLLGARFEHHGLELDFSQDNLFATVLRKSATRANECYKNYQRVDCDLANTIDGGGSTSCTAFDLAAGECVNQFDEFVSYPLYCSKAQIDAGACTEECTQAQIDSGDCDPGCSDEDIASGACPSYLIPVFHLLADEAQARFGKWLPVTDFSVNEKGAKSMFLLGVDSDAALADEGVVSNPSIWDVADDSGALLNVLTSIDGSIEQVVAARIDAADKAWVEVLASDVVQIGGTQADSIVSKALQIYLSNPKSTAAEAETVSEFQFLRPTSAME